MTYTDVWMNSLFRLQLNRVGHLASLERQKERIAMTDAYDLPCVKTAWRCLVIRLQAEIPDVTHAAALLYPTCANDLNRTSYQAR